MSKIYTEDLIRFIYNETSPQESSAILALSQTNVQLKSELESLQEIITQLDKIELKPSSTSISIIMEEAHRQSAALAH